MLSRTAIHDAFVGRFHVGERQELVTGPQLDQIEAELNTKLPAAYREFVTRHGIVFTPGILQEIVDKNIDHADVQYFLGPKEVIENMKAYWSAGMPKNVIGVASDCMGNMIGFCRHDETLDDAPVVFFDHDFVEVFEIAPSFDELLTWYLQRLKGHLTSR
jgi:hypothetical protein